MRLLLNVLAVSGSGAYAGALLAIGVILGGYWKALPAEEFLEAFRTSLPFIGRLVPAVLMPTVAGLAGSLWFAWDEKESRVLWLMALASTAALLMLTAAWFGPTNSQFAAGSLPLDQVPRTLDTWLMLHRIRIALAVAASILGVISISR
jgi:hypothetical protein